MKVTCDKCHGTGELEVEETRCTATIHIGSEVIECYGEDRHPGEPHMAIVCAPCYACGQYDEHDRTCGVYDMEPWAESPNQWYLWHDGDVSLTYADDEGPAWRNRHQPSSPYAQKMAAA